jgi:WD40 repeat protein
MSEVEHAHLQGSSEMSPPASRKLRELFLEAVEIEDAGPRAAFLNQACGEDADLRRRLEALLAADQAAGPTPPRPAPPDPRPGEGVGSVIGRYKLLEQIGLGGCGLVYMAEQLEPVRRQVALKIIKLGMDTKSVIVRFEAERQALALMDHPNIAKVHDAGATEAGRPYFVMELVRGIKITDYCDQNNLSTHQRLALFVQVCNAVQHAHQKGVIHRDLKPSNILVTQRDGVPVPKVIDFGIAKAITDQRLTDKTLYTAFEQFLGTPAYMSPEQAELSELGTDTRSDIYSLGVLLYELLTGSTPFNTRELLKSGLDEMRRTIREKDPPTPSSRLTQMQAVAAGGTPGKSQIKNQKSRIPADLDWIVMKCLEKDRSRRYATANGLATDIRRHLSQEPVIARRPSAVYKFQKFVLRNKVAVGAGGAVGLVLVFGALIGTWQAVRATRLRQQAETSAQRARQAEANEVQERRRAETQELVARQRAYASDINLAQQALGIDNLGRARELLDRQRPTPGQPDLRGWEWRYLWQQCQSDAKSILCQQSNPITSLSVSRDGRWLAIGELEDGLSVWDLQKRERVARLSAGEHMEGVQVAFSPAQPLLAFSGATSDTNGLVRLWDPLTRQTLTTELSLNGECRGLAFSEDGRRLITSVGAPGDELAILQIPEGGKLRSYTAPQSTSLEGTPIAIDANLSIAAHSDDRMKGYGIHFLDLMTAKERWTAPPLRDQRITALALSPDRKVLASGEGYLPSPVRLWDASTGKEMNRLEGHRGWISALVFWPDGKTLASASGDQTIRLWDISNVTNVPPPRILRGHGLEVWRLVLLPDAKTLVSGSKDGTVLVWDTLVNQRERARVILPERVVTWCFGQDSRSVLTVDSRGTVLRWSGSGFQDREVLLETGLQVDLNYGRRILISRDGRLVAITSTNGEAVVWDIARGCQIRKLIGVGGESRPCRFLSEGQRLVIVDLLDGSLAEWDLVTGEKTRAWRGAGPMWRLTCDFSPDNRWCLAVNQSGGTILRDLESGHEIEAALAIKTTSAASFSPDVRRFALSSLQGYTRLWETATLKETATLRGVLQGVHSVAWAPDGKRLATGSDGKEAIKVWDSQTYEELLTLEGNGTVFRLSDFSPDGNVLGSYSLEGFLHLWRAPSWAEIKAVEGTAEDKLSRQ